MTTRFPKRLVLFTFAFMLLSAQRWTPEDDFNHIKTFDAVLNKTVTELSRIRPINKDNNEYFTGVPSPAAAGLILLPLFIFFEFQIDLLKNGYFNFITTIVIGFMMISKIPTISIKKIKINPKYKTWIILFFVLVCVALISRIWITLICVIVAYLISVFYTILKSRNIKN